MNVIHSMFTKRISNMEARKGKNSFYPDTNVIAGNNIAILIQFFKIFKIMSTTF